MIRATIIDGCQNCGAYNSNCPDCRAKHGTGSPLAEATQRMIDGLTDKEREILARRFTRKP